MEKLELYKAWLANEEEIAALLEQLKPLLEKRHAFEETVPELGLLRDQRTVPGEEPPRLTRREEGPRQATLLVGSRIPLEGDPQRKVPTIEEFEKLAMKRKIANKKKHDKAKEKKKAKKMDLEKLPSPRRNSDSGKEN